MQWPDPSIRTNFPKEDKQNGGIGIDVSKADQIWTPDLYIYNLVDYKSYSDSKQIRSLTILTKNVLNQTKVELTLEAKSTVSCNFDLASYPMDKQMCEFRFGSRSSGATFLLHDPTKSYHNTINYKAANFHITITFVDGELKNGEHRVGFNIQMSRSIQPFIMKHYLPCIAIVLVCQISFVIPLTAIPGRVALLVTQFLTLTNLFIHQMVTTNQIF